MTASNNTFGPLSAQAVQDGRKLLNLAQRAYRAELREDQARQDALSDQLDAMLIPLLTAPTPLPLHETMTAFFEGCNTLPDGDGPAELVSQALQDLSESVAESDGSDVHRLFAVSLLVPAQGRDWEQPLAPSELEAVTGALYRNGLVAEDAQVTWLPLAVPFSYVLDLSEWSVSQVAHQLATGQVASALALVQSLATPVIESTAVPPQADARLMESRILIGVARIGERIEFPLGAQVMTLLERAEDHQAATHAVESSRESLDTLASELQAVFGVEDLQVMAEVQGWWADVGAAHQLMRATHASQQLQALLRQHGLFAQEVLASSDLRAVSDEPIGMEVTLYRKNELSFLGTLRFLAIPSEAPDDCAEETLEFLASSDVTVVAGELLRGATSGGSGEASGTPRLLH